MPERLFVGTRKGLFTFERTGGGWSCSGTAFLALPVTMLLPDRVDGHLYAALRHGHYGAKMHRSADGGGSWEEIPSPAFPPSDNEGPSVEQVWSLESGGLDRPGTLWAGTLPGALFFSEDRGDSWQLNTALWDRPERSSWFGGGYDVPGIHSICVDPRDSDQLTVGVSCGGVWHSEDHGETWETRTRGMFATYMPPEQRELPEIQDPHRLVRCPRSPDVLWVQHHNGVFVSRDNGSQWQECPDASPSTFGFAVAVHPHEPDTAWLAPAVADECRIPVDGALVVSRTHDGGRSFEVLRQGLPQEHAYDLIYRHALEVDGGGNRLALASTTGGLWISEDGGDRWSEISTHLPPVYCLRFG